MALPLVAHIPYCTFNHIRKTTTHQLACLLKGNTKNPDTSAVGTMHSRMCWDLGEHLNASKETRQASSCPGACQISWVRQFLGLCICSILVGASALESASAGNVAFKLAAENMRLSHNFDPNWSEREISRKERYLKVFKGAVFYSGKLDSTESLGSGAGDGCRVLGGKEGN